MATGGARAGAGIAGFLTGLVTGASESYEKEQKRRHDIETKFMLEDADRLIKSGDVEQATIALPTIEKTLGSNVAQRILDSARSVRLQNDEKTLRTLTTLKGLGMSSPELDQQLQQLQRRINHQRNTALSLRPMEQSTLTEQAPQESQAAPQATAQAPRRMEPPGPLREQTIGPPAVAQPPARRPSPIPPPPSQRRPADITTNLSKEGELSFSFIQKAKDVDERARERASQLEVAGRRPSEVVTQLQEEGYGLKPDETQAIGEGIFARKMGEFIKTNFDELRDLDPETRLILAKKFVAELMPGEDIYIPKELRQAELESRKLSQETTEVLRGRGVSPLTAQPSSIEAAREISRQREIQTSKEKAVGTRQAEIEVPIRPSETERGKAAERMVLLDRLSTIRMLSTNQMLQGPIANQWKNIQSRLLGSLPVNENAFRAEVNSLQNKVIQDITGAAIGQRDEERRLMSEIPTLNLPRETFKGNFVKTWRNSIALALRNVEQDTAANILVPQIVVDRIKAEINEYEKTTGQPFTLQPNERWAKPGYEILYGAKGQAPASAQQKSVTERYQELLRSGVNSDTALGIIAKEQTK